MKPPNALLDVAGVVAGYALDRAIGDPARHHPVAWFGSWAGWLERRLWAPSRPRGAAYLVATTLPPVALTAAASHGSATRRVVVTTAVTWAALGGRSLGREALAVHALLDGGDLPGARRRIRSLVGRDTSEASAHDLARATVESLAENQSDAVTATLVWGLTFGAPGVVLHRCANTLDAMVGHRTPRFEQFGWAAARFDDVLNAVPARVSVAATALSTRSFAGARNVLETVRRDAPAHPSPNAGLVEAAAAAALGVRIGGTNIYSGRIEHRGELGDGRPVEVSDIPRAVALCRTLAQIVLSGGVLLRLSAHRLGAGAA